MIVVPLFSSFHESFPTQRYFPSGCSLIRTGLFPALKLYVSLKLSRSATATRSATGMLTKSRFWSLVITQSAPGRFRMICA